MAVTKEKVQRTVYLDPDVSRCMDHVAADLGVPLYEAIDKGLRTYLDSVLTAEERRVYRFEGLSVLSKKKKVKR